MNSNKYRLHLSMSRPRLRDQDCQSTCPQHRPTHPRIRPPKRQPLGLRHPSLRSATHPGTSTRPSPRQRGRHRCHREHCQPLKPSVPPRCRQRHRPTNAPRTTRRASPTRCSLNWPPVSCSTVRHGGRCRHPLKTPPQQTRTRWTVARSPPTLPPSPVWSPQPSTRAFSAPTAARYPQAEEPRTPDDGA